MKFDLTMSLSHTGEQRSQAKLRGRNSRKMKKVLKRFRRKASRGKGRTSHYPVVRKMYRVEAPWEVYSRISSFRQKIGRGGAGHARHWARESLSRRFVRGDTAVDPQKDLAGQAGLVIRSDPTAVRAEKFKSRFSVLVGNPNHRKKFLKICRGILGDLGLSLVGPLPMRALEIMWQYFGEAHFSVHGTACWCRLCRSVGPSRMLFVQAIGDALYEFFVTWKFAVNTIFGLIAPSPLRMAKFVSNKLWKWVKILCPGAASAIGL